MQDVSADFLAALEGSVQPVVIADAWYDGELVAENLPLTKASVSFDRSRSIVGSLSMSVASADGTLAPLSWNSPLAPFGSEVHVRAGFGDELLSLGWFRIQSADPSETWARYEVHDDTRWVRRSVAVDVECSDRAVLLDDFKLMAPEQPAQLVSAQAEIERLVQDVVPLADLSGVADQPIPRDIEYSDSRLDVLNTLANLMDASVGMDPDGALALWPLSPAGPVVWQAAVQVTALSWSNQQSRDGLYNAVVASGDDPEYPVQGMAIEEDGPLRWGGPFGMVPYAHSNPMLWTVASAERDARTVLDRLIRERVVTVSVSVIANPALQVGDRIELLLPDRALTGVVDTIEVDLPETAMTLGVSMPREQLWSFTQDFGTPMFAPMAIAARP